MGLECYDLIYWNILAKLTVCSNTNKKVDFNLHV